MSAPEPFDQAAATCPYCQSPVGYKWATGARDGFIAEPHNALIADCVYHADCWEKLVAAHRPSDPALTEPVPEFGG